MMIVIDPVGPDTRTRHSQAAAAIGQRIVAGEWHAGAALPTEADLSRQLSVSRASLREAIKLLAGKGLIRSTPRRGTIVQPQQRWHRLDPDLLVWQAAHGQPHLLLRELFELRHVVEPEAAAFAAVRAGEPGRRAIADAIRAMELAATPPALVDADRAFHRAVILTAGNSLLASFAPAIDVTIMLALQLGHGALDDTHALPLHKTVADLILAGRPAEARAAMSVLLDQAQHDGLLAAAGMIELNGAARRVAAMAAGP